MSFPTILILGLIALGFVVAHHIGYFRGTRRPAFGAFLETGGWLILVLVSAAGALVGAWLDPAGARVLAASTGVGVVCIGVGLRLQRRRTA